MIRWSGILALVVLCPCAGAAQDTTAAARPAPAADTTAVLRPVPAVTLSLQEALQQARANSPAYRQTLNDAGPAKWGVRNAYGNLLPGVSVGSDLGYTGSGESNFGGGFVRSTSAFVTSGYNLSLQWQLNGRALTAPAEQKALQRATDEDISGAGVDLRAEIETQYLSTLQATAQVAVARQQVVRNADFLRLANARYQVGQATLLDVRQAEVTKGQSDVALLRAVQAENEAKLDLLRRMGVEPPAPVDQIVLSDSFPVTAPALALDSLLALADEQNPALRSLRARRTAASFGVRSAKSEFLPTLSAQAGWSGFTQQFTNEGILIDQTLSDAQSQAAGCQSNNEVRAAVGLRHQRLLRGRRAQPPGHGAPGRRHGADPHDQRCLPLRLHPSAVPGQSPALAADLHGVRALAPAVPGARDRAGRRRDRPSASAPGAERRARPLPRPSDLLPGHRGPGSQSRGRARPAAAGTGPLPARRRHVARSLGRPECRAAGGRRLCQRGL